MKSRIVRVATIILSFLLCMYFPKILRNLFAIPGSKLFVTSLGYPFTILIIVISFYILHKYNIIEIISELGLKRGFTKGFLFGLIATLPMTVSSAILFKFSNNLFSYYTLITVFMAPFMEEILFRGYLFGQLFRKERWGFIPSSIIATLAGDLSPRARPARESPAEQLNLGLYPSRGRSVESHTTQSNSDICSY